MKLTITRTLDSDRLLASLQKVGVEGGEDLVDYLNDLSDQLSGILRQGLTAEDNLDVDVKILSLKHNVTQVVAIKDKKKLKHVIPTRTQSFDNPVTALAWQYNAKGECEVKVQLLGAPTEPVLVTAIFWY